MSERELALADIRRAIYLHEYNPEALMAQIVALAAPPVGVSPQPDTRRDCTCLGTCRGAEGLGPRWKCALEKSAPLSPVEPTPDAQVCVWRDDTYGYRLPVCPESSAVTRWTLASNMKEWKVCPYCGKRLVVGTAPQGGEQ